MKISISLNEVIRDFIGQMFYTYEKYIGKTNLTYEDITGFNLIDYFKFDDINKFNTFLYSEAPLEIFGHADQMSDGLMNHFNFFIMENNDEDGHTIELVSREIDKAIPSTFFFLSKTACKISNIRFVKQNIDEWGDADILITANPVALENKPSNKISVKVKAPYNKDVKADYEINSLLDLLKDEELKNKIFSTKIITTTYEEI